MKILAIRIKNLASIEGEFEIDFKKEPLRSAGIFAITGATGSGKSTILDAICLALFAKTPRNIEAKENGIELIDYSNNKIKQGDIRSILRKGSSSAYAEIDFIGIDKQTYRSSWNVRRAGNKINGNLQSDTIELLNLQTNYIFPEKKTETLKEIERLIGLNFEQFTRSVLLAQGDFTAFLKAEKDEKSSLLERLTGTEIYSEISKKTYENYRISENELKELNIKIEGINILPEAEYHETISKKEEIKQIINELEIKIQKNKDNIKWYNELTKLQEELIFADTNLKHLENQKIKDQERIEKLNFIEAIQSFKIIFNQKKSTEETFTKKESENKKLIADINITKLNINELSNNLILIENKNKKSIIDKQIAQTLIDKAKELDIIISEKNEQLKLQNIEINKDISEKQKSETKIKHNFSKINILKEEQNNIIKWENDNKNRKQIADNITLIISKLEDLKKGIKSNNEINIEITSFKQKTIELEKLISEKSILINENEIKLQTSKNEYIKFNEKIKQTNINLLNNNSLELNQKIEKIAKGIGIWNLYSQNADDCTLLKDALDKGKETIINHKNTIERLNKELEENKFKKEQTQKILTKAEITTTKSVEGLRQNLTENEECPVCGSTQHPYAKGIDKVKNILEDIQKEMDFLNNEYDKIVKEIAGLESTINKTKSDLLKNTENYNNKTLKNNELYNSWIELKIIETKHIVTNSDKQIWLNIELVATKDKLQNIQLEIVSYNNTLNQLNNLKENTDELEKNKFALINQTDIYKTDLLNISSNISKTENNLIINEQQIMEICNFLNLYFINQEWFTEWEKNNTIFEEKLRTWSEEWFKNIKKSETLKANIQDLETETQKDQEKMNHFTSSLKSKELIINNIKESLSELIKKRKHIFDGKDTIIIENELNKAIEDTNEELNKAKEENTNYNNELIRLIAINEQNNNDLKELSEILVIQNTEIENWINTYNITYSQNIHYEKIIENIHYNTDWIEIEKNYIKTLNDNIIKLKTTFEEKGDRYKIHFANKISENTLEEVEEFLQNNLITIEEQRIISNELDFRLKTNDNNKQLITDFQEEIKFKTENFENWQKINDLIGSADGKKFRQIAQEYTLDILLNYANKQLKLLSSRYFLSRIENTLALQVIDKDMGNETRSVYSLSGGESFIVSLALALGLASLSSNKMQVESLFIDEGFGSLDPATLSIAMDALEQLYNQGRKVGVISHIQEMTERIPTQIKVIKQTNGKSKIEITRN